MQSDLYLRVPCLYDENAFLEYTNEYFNDNSEIVICGFKKGDNYKNWLKNKENESNGIVKNDRVPSSFYFLVDDKKIVGCISIRHNLNNEFLKKYGGHIGYNVRPSERGKGYASKMLYLALFKCIDLGLTDIMITCKKDNIASSKVIENNGGKLYKELFIPEEDDIFKIYWLNVYESLIDNEINKTI